MYISRLLLDPRSRLVRQETGDRYRLHRTLMSGFPQQLPVDERVLYRLETARSGVISVLMQSRYMPDWAQSERLNALGVLVSPAEVKEWNPVFHASQLLLFRLEANPTVKREGKRHALLKEAQQSAWLARNATEHGFQVHTLQIGQANDSFGRNEMHAMKWHGVRFDGVLRVTDAALFAQAVACGIGSAKAFGFGLLSIAPIRG